MARKLSVFRIKVIHGRLIPGREWHCEVTTRAGSQCLHLTGYYATRDAAFAAAARWVCLTYLQE